MRESRFLRYTLENPGADFVAAFIVALIIVAIIYPLNQDMANEIMNFAFFSLIIGVVLQVIALGLHRGDEEPR